MFSKVRKNLTTLFFITALVMFTQPAWGRGGGGGHGGGGFRSGGGMGRIGGGGFRGAGPRVPMGVSSPARMSGSSFRHGGFRSAGAIGVRSPGSSFRSGSGIGVRNYGGGLNRGASIGGFDGRSRGGRRGSGLVVSGRRGGNISIRSGGRRGGHFAGNDVFNHDFTFRKGFFNRGILDGRARFQRQDFALDARRGDFQFVRNPSFSRFYRDRFFFNPFFNNRFFFRHRPSFRRRLFFNPFFGSSVIFIGAPYYYPYYDYGYYPRPYDSGGNTYNYYYYNTPGQMGDAEDIKPADKSGYRRPEKHATPTEADTYFDAGVAAFAKEDYTTAMQKFAEAKDLAPDDKVLPFAYAQAVFAMSNYSAAAQALRQAVSQIDPETEGVFYPRGLYTDENVLLKQIAALRATAAKDRHNANLQLLLGYNELGMGELDKAEAALKRAVTDEKNGPAANALLKLVEKLREAKAEAARTQQAPK